MRALGVTCGLLLLTLARPAAAEDRFAGPSDYLTVLGQLVPGDRLLLEPGTYSSCLSIDGLHGTEAAPIEIVGPPTGARARFSGPPCVNREPPLSSVILRLQDASWLAIRNLELDGERASVVGFQAGYGRDAIHHITLENLHVHDNDNSPQITGISCFAPAWGWVIRGNVLERVGLGLYLGDSDGSDPFIGGIVENNVVVDPVGYAMQIKHQNPRPAFAGMPGDGSVTLIRNNVFIKSAGSATGNAARPSLLVGHLPLSGPGVNDRYEIYGNFLYENDSGTEPLFQGEGNLAFHDNILVNTYSGPGVWIRPHNDVPKDVAVYRNTVLTAGMGIVVMGGDAAFRQRVEGNAVFSDTMAIAAADESNNVTGAMSNAGTFVVNANPTLGQLDLYPLAGALEGGVLDWSDFSAHIDVDRDFNGVVRSGRFRGAYAGSGTNPGWMLAAMAKGVMGATPGGDAGVGDAGVGDAKVRDSGVGDAGSPDARVGDARVVPIGGSPIGVPGGRMDPSGGCACVAVRSQVGLRWLILLCVLLAVVRRRLHSTTIKMKTPKTPLSLVRQPSPVMEDV